MTVEELRAVFPEVPASLRDEPVLARFADCCDALLRSARKPSNCAAEYDAANHYYLKLIGPLSIHGYGLSSREKVVGQLEEIVGGCQADPAGFAASLLPAATAAREVRGSGCD